jgi:hypothetical protein
LGAVYFELNQLSLVYEGGKMKNMFSIELGQKDILEGVFSF